MVPVALATMLAALLLPVVDFLDRRGAPRGGAVALVLLGGIAAVGGILTFVVTQFIEGAPALVEQVSTSIKGVGDWLTTGPLHVNQQQIDAGPQVGYRGAAEQPGEADQRGAVDGGHRDRDRHRCAAGVVHADLPLARRPQHLRVCHQGLSGKRAGAGARRRPGRLSFADRLCARDVPGRARRRRRHRYRPGHHGYAAGVAVGVAGVPRRVHPARRCGDRRFLRRCRGADRQGLDLRADHARLDHRRATSWKAMCCSRL